MSMVERMRGERREWWEVLADVCATCRDSEEHVLPVSHTGSATTSPLSGEIGHVTVM